MATPNRLRWRVLGPFEVLDGQDSVDVGAGKQRALLALLVVRRGSSVSVDEVMQELWPEGPPPTGHKTVQVYVSRLRKSLGSSTIKTQGAGYRLDLDDDALDAAVFETSAREARELLSRGDARGARDLLAGALALWLGRPLGDIDADFAASEVARLDEVRLGVVEDRIDADLALGRHRAVTSELRRLVEQEPLRERLRAQLMLALYRSGRQADALEVYRDSRRFLVDELGLEPGPALRDLERRIFAHDPTLRATEEPLPPMPRRSRRRRLVIAAAGAVATAVAAAAILTGGTGGAPSAPRHAIAVIDAADERVVARIPVAADPVGVAVGDDVVWVASMRDQVLQRIDPRRRAVVRTLGLGSTPSAVAAGTGVVWVANGADGTLTRIETATSSVGDSVRVRARVTPDFFARPTPSTLAAGVRAVWANRDLAGIARLPSTGRGPRAASLGPGRSSDALALGFGALWVASGEDGKLYRLDPTRLAVTGSTSLRDEGRAVLAVGGEAIWVGLRDSGRVVRVDPRTLRSTHVGAVDTPLVALAAGAGGIWTLSGEAATVHRIDHRSGRIVRRIPVGGRPTALAAGAGAVWVTTTASRPGPPPAGPVRAVQATSCQGIYYGGSGAPSRLVVLDTPVHWADSPGLVLGMRRDVDAVKDVLRRHGFQAGRLTVGLQVCADSTKQAGYWTEKRCVANARAYAATPALAGIIGPVHSGCARMQLPVLADAPGGQPPQIGYNTTYLGLTRPGPATAPDEPEAYGTGARRAFVRPAGPDDAQGVALAQLAQRLGAYRVVILDDATSHGMPVSRAARAALEAEGIDVVSTVWNARAPNYRRVAGRIASRRADAVILAGCICANGGRLVRDLRAVLGSRFPLLASDVWSPIEYLREQAGPAALGVYMTVAGAVPEHLDARARALVQGLGPMPSGEDGNPGEVVHAAQSIEILLQAIARSDGERKSVRHELFHGQFDTIAGTVRFDARGDVIAPQFTAYRVERRGTTTLPIVVDPEVLTRVRRQIGSL